MHVVLRPGHWLMLFSTIWFATVERTAWQFLLLGMAGEKNMGGEILQDIHQITRIPEPAESMPLGCSSCRHFRRLPHCRPLVKQP